MIASVDPTQIGQALLGCLIVISYASSRFKIHETKDKVEEVHVLVNSQMSLALERIASLEQALGLEPGDPVPERKP